MMLFLSRKYIRVFTYLSIIMLSIFTLNHYLLKYWIKDYKYQQVRFVFKEEYNVDYLIDQLDWDPNDHLMTNIGMKRCYHIFKQFQWCFHMYQLFDNEKPLPNSNNMNKDDIDIISYFTKRRIVEKDLTGSYQTEWFGSSLYYFYDTINIPDIIPLILHFANDNDNNHNPRILKGFKSISLISNDNENNNNNKYIQFDKFLLEPIDLTIDLLKSGEINSIITDFTILFGDDCVDPRPDWTLIKSTAIYDHYLANSYLSYKTLVPLSIFGNDNGNNTDWKNVELYPNEDGKFKIVQLSDLHMGINEGKCLDEYPIPVNRDTEPCRADPKTLNFINTVLDIEKPQLVVFTGDQIMGQESLQDSETTLLKAISPVIERKIPWALTWGNHDDEGSLSRWQLSELVVRLPYTIFQFSGFDTKDNTFGVGNYIKQIKQKNDSADGDGLPLITLYFLDSHKYSKSSKLSPGYDWIKEKQWNHIKKVYENNLKSDILKVPNHLSMAFFHIPLPEYLNQKSKKNPDSVNEIVGTFKEGVTAPKYNSGGLMALDSMEVQVTSCGHDHCNDYCLKDDSTPNHNIWLCYGGSAGERAYAGYGGTERRIRIYELDTKVGSIKSWKRLNGSPEEIFDFQILVNNQSI
ncbi:phosphoprotein phosphatase PWA37_002639 [Arxiozyma heterogenica]|uniref:phosphoprotein phosphatase n=1 Tax=Arxiozyma heterogenica TaxID=278026 RepID=UPI002EF7D678